MFYVYAYNKTQGDLIAKSPSKTRAHTLATQHKKRFTGATFRVTTKYLGATPTGSKVRCAPGCSKCMGGCSRVQRSPEKTPHCPIGTEIQTLVFHKPQFSRITALKWARTHGFSTPKTDVTGHSIRIRQHSPGDFLAGSFRALHLTHGVIAVIGCPR